MRFVDHAVAAQRGHRRARPGAGHPGGARHRLRQRVTAPMEVPFSRDRVRWSAASPLLSPLRPVRLRRGARRRWSAARAAVHPHRSACGCGPRPSRRDVSRLLGVNVGRMLTLGWALAAGGRRARRRCWSCPTELGLHPARDGPRVRLRVHRGGRRRAGQPGRRGRRRAGRRPGALATSAATWAATSPPIAMLVLLLGGAAGPARPGSSPRTDGEAGMRPSVRRFLGDHTAGPPRSPLALGRRRASCSRAHVPA